MIEHVLVVMDDCIVAAELVIEFVLSVRQDVFLICQSSCVRVSSVRLGPLLVLPQVRVESAFAVGWAVLRTQTSAVV